jgi:hypothetical protein
MAQAVEASHKRALQRRWDAERQLLIGQPIRSVVLDQLPGFEKCLRQLFNEKGHAIRLGHDLAQH